MNSIKFIIIALPLLILASCSPDIRTISSSKLTINQEETEIVCHPPLQRTTSTATLSLAIKEEWDVDPSWESVNLKDGRKVGINIRLISTLGKEFRSSIIGRAGMDAEIWFKPEIPKDVKINKIVLSATQALNIERIQWLDFFRN
jgi:hypothetical protein